VILFLLEQLTEVEFYKNQSFGFMILFMGQSCLMSVGWVIPAHYKKIDKPFPSELRFLCKLSAIFAILAMLGGLVLLIGVTIQFLLQDAA